MDKSTRVMRRVNTKIFSAVLLGLCCALGTSALIARQQMLTREGPTSVTGLDLIGEIRPATQTILTAPAAVLVDKTLVAVGDKVAAGQPLLELNDSEAHAALRNARLTRDAAAARVAYLRDTAAFLESGLLGSALGDANGRLAIEQRQLEQVPVRQWKDSPERARAAYDQALARQRRIEELARLDMVSRQELDDAQVAVRIARNDLDNAEKAAAAADRLAATQMEQARLQSKFAVAERRRQRMEAAAELQNAEFELTRAEADLQRAAERVEDLIVRATTDGTVVEVAARMGDRLPMGSLLAKVAVLDSLVVQVEVPAHMINGIHKRQVAKLTIASDGSSRLGHVRTVAPLPSVSGAHAVEIQFDNPDGALLVSQAAHVRFRS